MSIRSKAALDRAIAEIDALLGRPARTRIESKRLDLLSDAVREYERGKMPVAVRSPAERLRTLLELHEMNANQLAAEVGVGPDAIGGFLAGGCLTEREASALARYFALDDAAFRN